MSGAIIDTNAISQLASDLAGTNESHLNGVSFLLSLATILVCEIGDKTFFLAMVMAMKYNQWVVFVGSYGALAVMTVLSTAFGAIITKVIHSKLVTGLIVAGLFFFFGGKLLYEAYHSPDDEEENQELKDVIEELKEMEERLSQSHHPAQEAQVANQTPSGSKAPIPNNFILTQAFIMTFLAEWGDRSQIATVSLAVSDSAVMVTLGALLGHLVCTGGAVKLGNWISDKVKERTIHYIAGAVFILSGLITLVGVIKSDG